LPLRLFASALDAPLESDAALSKAFHRVVGVAPSAFRREGAQQPVT
jgi:AraC-like DNA-binding protein